MWIIYYPSKREIKKSQGKKHSGHSNTDGRKSNKKRKIQHMWSLAPWEKIQIHFVRGSHAPCPLIESDLLGKHPFHNSLIWSVELKPVGLPVFFLIALTR